MSKLTKAQKRVCLRCGLDEKEKEVGEGCSSWGRSFKQHKWGKFEGETISVKIK